MRVCADVHLGNHVAYGGRTLGGVNERFEEGFQVFQKVLESKGPLFILGDLFDKAEPTTAQLGRVAEALASRGDDTHLLLGNHESGTFADYDHALAPLVGTRGVVVHTEPGVVLVGNLRVFVCPYPHHLFDHAPERVDVALAHAGIADGATPKYLLGPKVLPIDDLVKWQERHHVRMVFSGDWHTRKTWVDGRETAATSNFASGNVSIQVGALVPTGWDNPGFGYGSVWEVTKHPTVSAKVHLQRGPRFLRTASMDEANKFISQCTKHGYTPYVKYDGYTEDRPCDNFKCDVKPVGVAEVKTAAVQVRSLTKLEQVVVEQVQKVPEVYRADVQRVVLDGLRGTQ